MTAALRRLGFEVTTVRDADRTAMTEALRVFTRESAGADGSQVFYARHGLEMDGVNYLVPVDARLERDTDARFEAVDLDYVDWILVRSVPVTASRPGAAGMATAARCSLVSEG